MQLKMKKIIALLLVTIMIYAVAAPITSYAVNNQNVATNNKNVEADISFENGEHSKVSDIKSTDTKINVSLKVKNTGYLENITVDFSDANFNISGDAKQEGIQNIQDNKLVLNRINANGEINVELIITPKTGEIISSDMFNRDNKITIYGTYFNENSKESSINKEVLLHLEWNEDDVKAQIEQNITKYIPYDIDNKKGLLLETTIDTKIENDKLPVKTTNIEYIVPTIQGEQPEKVVVVANSNNTTWNYNSENGKVTIYTQNEINNGQIAWSKNIKDIYKIICVYSEDVYTEINGNSTSVTMNSNVSNELYNNVETKISQEATNTIALDKQVGNVVDVSAIISESKLNKGYMYNNKKETLYTKSYVIDIANSELVDNININQENDIFTNSTREYTANTYNKTISVDKTELEKILGVEGTIAVLSGTTKIGELNTNTTSIDISENKIDNIILQLSTPKAEGRLNIKIEKAISKDIAYTTEDIKQFESLKTKTTVTASKVENNISVTQSEGIVALEEPTAKAIINVNKENLSTVIKNENVEIKAILETNSVDDKMYSNPQISIVLPEYIEELNIKTIDMLYTDELEISSYNIVENSDGTTTINISVSGTQTEYNDTKTNGPTVFINADITLNKLTPSKNEEIIFTCNDSETKLTERYNINYVAPTGLVTINSIENYADNAEKIMAISGEDKQIILDTFSESRTAKISGQLINNLSNDMNSVKVLGRIPTENGKDNNFTAKLTSAINTSNSNMKVYYSENANATTELEDSNNKWVQAPDSYDNVKSFLIVEEQTMENASIESFEYDVTIPENLEYNKAINTSYEVTYNEASEVGEIPSAVTSPVIKLTTGQGPNIDVKLESALSENTVRQGQYISFHARISNTGTDTAKNVTLKVNVPENTTYVEYNVATAYFKEIANPEPIVIGELKAGETKTITYYLKVNENASTNNAQIDNFVTLQATDIKEVKSNNISYSIEEGKISLVNSSDNYTNENFYIEQGQELTYFVTINNLVEEKLDNITVEYKVPDGMSINKDKTGKIVVQNNEIDTQGISINNNTVTYKIDTLDEYGIITLAINVNVENIVSSPTSYAQAYLGNNKYTSNSITFNEVESKATLTAKLPDNKYVKEGEKVVYEFTIKNEGQNSLKDSEITCLIPEEIIFEKAEISYSNGNNIVIDELQDNNLTHYDSNMQSGTTMNIKIMGTTHSLSDENDKEANMTLKFTAKGIADQTSTASYVVEYDKNAHENAIDKEQGNESSNPENPGNNDETVLHKITGQVWFDENNNGQKDDNEKRISGVEVILLNSITGEVVREGITTDENGKYEFANLEDGEYLIAYIYDESEYSITQYQKADVSSSVNSDATNIQLLYDNTLRRAGITDKIKIEQSNVRDIDLGLVTADKFNLSLDKKISKVTLNNDNGTEEYDYTKNPKQISKIEIPSKYVDSSTVIVEYTITVTNNGTVPGYVKKVVDYIPDGMKFNSELNTQWYLGTDGNAYNLELGNTLINPGESKQITIILTKKMTSNNIGMVSNSAEIYEAYNEKALNDENSTPANKNTSEDDMSTANLVISVKTGQVTAYLVLTTIVVVVLGIGTYTIKRYFLDRKI